MWDVPAEPNGEISGYEVRDRERERVERERERGIERGREGERKGVMG